MHLGNYSSPKTPLDVCVFLVECLITVGVFDLLCRTGVLSIVPKQACVSCYLRFSPTFFSCHMSVIENRF